MANGLLDYISGFGATPPEYLGGLLGQEAVDKLKGRAATTGIANAVLGYLAAPKNQNLGLGRIIGQSLQAGMQGAQGVYDTAAQDYMAQQKIADLQRKQAQQAQMQSMIAGIQDPNERLFAELAPEQYVTSKLKPMERKFEKIGNQLVDVSGGTPTVAFTGTAESNQPSAVQEYNFAKTQGYTGSFTDWKRLQKPEGVNVTYGAPVSGLDAQGNPVFFQPAKGGGAPAIIPGVTPQPAVVAAPTESQAKAATFYSQMTSASDELKNLKTEGFDPNNPAIQAQVSIAGTRAGAFVPQEAQRARQAQEQWAESFLRIKTGAAATKDEVDRNVKTFFPSIGDKPEAVAQKERARAKAEQDVLKMTKPSAQQKSNFTVKDQQALDWAKQNPNDPRATQIKQRLGL